MVRYLLDTDHLTLLDCGRAQLVARIAAQPVGTVGVSAITVEESLRGRVSLRLRIGHRDLKIAAVALANNLTLLTRNKSDFSAIPGLVIADWSQ